MAENTCKTVKGVTSPQVRSLPGVESDGRPCGAHAPPGRQGGAAQEAAVPPRTAPLLALEATLTLRGITSCWVCCEPAGAVRAAADARSAVGGRQWSARGPAKVGSVSRARAGWTGPGTPGAPH